MQCPECQFDNPAEAKFCNECGRKLDISCPNCSNLNPAGSKFCNECGHNLSLSGDAKELKVSSPSTLQKHEILDSTSVPEGERRQATVVFSDLSGYTSMNEILDPEEVEVIMSRIKQEAVRIVEHHGGIVNQFVGDEVLNWRQLSDLLTISNREFDKCFVQTFQKYSCFVKPLPKYR